MITRLLEVFDPCVSKTANVVNWITLSLALLIVNKQWIGVSNKITGVKDSITKNFQSMITATPFNLVVPLSLMIMIAIINILGLLPYNWRPTSSPSLNFSIALFLVLITWINILTLKLKDSLVHFVPKDSPTALIFPLTMIELVRLLIRPLTLSIRLTANITAGHIVITLTSELADHSSKRIVWPLTAVPNIALVLMETMVRLVQRLIIALLITLYTQEATT